jgi:hypothetical protein
MLSIRGWLLHITHYDPAWCRRKEQEEPFDLALGLELVDEMARAGLNLLLIDPKDAVRYPAHPELARPYTLPMETLVRLREHAEARGIEVALKLNFSQSELHRHNHWFRPHNDLFDIPEYWRLAFEVIDELLAAARPPRFFHIGMDEDHARSSRQYLAAIHTLHDGLARRGLRTVIWNDSACGWPAAEIHKDKSLLAEWGAPRDVVHVVWSYWGADAALFRRVRDAGFELWGAPGGKPDQVRDMRQALEETGAGGILLTHWSPCVPANRDKLLAHVRTLGPLCRDG